jgi:hypothetical protein
MKLQLHGTHGDEQNTNSPSTTTPTGPPPSLAICIAHTTTPVYIQCVSMWAGILLGLLYPEDKSNMILQTTSNHSPNKMIFF